MTRRLDMHPRFRALSSRWRYWDFTIQLRLQGQRRTRMTKQWRLLGFAGGVDGKSLYSLRSRGTCDARQQCLRKPASRCSVLPVRRASMTLTGSILLPGVSELSEIGCMRLWATRFTGTGDGSTNDRSFDYCDLSQVTRWVPKR